MKTTHLIIVFLLVVLAAAGLIYLLADNDINMTQFETEPADSSQSAQMAADEITLPKVAVLHTNHGPIELELLAEAPITAGNFLQLAEAGFYDGTLFHRVIVGFMIQGGDPLTKGDNPALFGTGGPGYTIPDEFAPGLSNTVGTLSMANAGPNTGGSQFFINTADNLFLDGRHAVFGRVTDGLEVVRAIEQTSTDNQDRPLEPVMIERIEIKD